MNKLIKTTALLLAMTCGGEWATARDLFVGPEANVAVGTPIKYRDIEFIGGQTAFTGIWAALGAYDEGDRIFFSANTIGSFTINKKNVKLYGANAWCDAWSNQRNANAETNITGTLTINASGVEVNGFCFKGNGCVRNDAAGRGSTCLEGFSYVYNRCTGTTLAAGSNVALLYLGDAWRPANSDATKQNPSAWAAIERYHNVYIAHNSFEGNAAESQPGCIQVAGSAAGTVITDNRFNQGGTSISLFNTQGDFEVSHNQFTKVGVGVAKGEFCLRLYYIGCSAAAGQYVTGKVQHNYFDGCTGQSSMYPLIRFYSGDSNETIYSPNSANLYVNYNTFRNKTTVESSGYNYVFYANNTNTTTANVDIRWNQHDNTEMCYAWAKPKWETAAKRYFAGSQNRFNYESSHGTTLGFYGQKDSNGTVLFGRATPTGGAGGLKNWTVGTKSVAGRKATQVVQSCDIDDATGDVYLAIDNNTTNAFGKAVDSYFNIPSSNFLFLSRVDKANSAAETHMYLSNCGHGSNMAVTRANGKVYIVTGCPSTSSTSTTSNGIGLIPWTAGQHINLATSTGYIKLNKNYGHSNPYPSVDNDNRLLVVRSRQNTGDYIGDFFTVYDLDEVLANPSTVNYIKQVFVRKGDKKITNSSRACLNTQDTGFKTWSDQGFTICGDYIYTLEGDGKEGYDGNPTPSDGKPVYIINLINWRTGEYVYRKAILAGAIITNMSSGSDSGEPESIKIHRDDYGRPCMHVGCVTGASGDRRYNLFCYKLKQENGQGDVLDIDPHAFDADQSSLSFSTWDAAQSASVNASVSGHTREVTGTIVGADGENFTVGRNGNRFDVTFNPNRWKRNYNAYLRLSSPNTADKMIPLSGTYNGTLQTGIQDVTNIDADAVKGAPRFFDLSGRELTEPAIGVNIIVYPNGNAEKLIIK